MNARINFFEKVKKTEIREIEKKLIHIHKTVLSNFISSYNLNKEKIIACWKKCHIYETDVIDNIILFFENYKNFAIFNETNISIGKYFMYLNIYLKNVKIKKNPFRAIKLHIFNNNKWKDKLIFQFLKDIFLNDENYTDCKTLVIENLINNYDIFSDHIKYVYISILRYINENLKISFLKKNQNYLNIFANFLITFNSNATIELKTDILKIFFFISKNLKKILLQFPFDKDICTHVCLIHQQIKNIINNYETNINNILNNKERFYYIVEENFNENEHFEKNNSTVKNKNYKNCFIHNSIKNNEINSIKTKFNELKKYEIKINDISINTEIKDDNIKKENTQNQKEEKEIEKKDIYENNYHRNVSIFNKYVLFIEKIKKIIENCDDIIKKKKKENPFLILCKYRSILIIKYKYIINANVNENFDYFLLFFKIKNLLCCSSKNPVFIFMCIESINYWLQKNEKIHWIFEDLNKEFLNNEEDEKSNSLFKSNNCGEEFAQNSLLNTKSSSNKEKYNKCECINVVDENLSTKIYYKNDEIENNYLSDGNIENVKEQNYKCHVKKNTNENVLSIKKLENKENFDLLELDEIMNTEQSVKISNLKIYFKNCNYEKKIEYLKKLYTVIIRSILLILKKYSWYNIKIIWNSCMCVYELLLTSKKYKFIKNDIYNILTYIIFNQEKKKKYLCLSLLLKYFKKSMCEKNILEYLFYCFFIDDEFFMSSLYELIKQCIKHIFIHSEDKYLLYYIFIKNILLTKHFFLKTFYIKKFIELFFKNDNNYICFILNKEYFYLKKYFDEHQKVKIKKGEQKYIQKNDHLDNVLYVNNINDSKEMLNEDYFQILKNKLLEENCLSEIIYNNIINKKEENIFLNYKIINTEKKDNIIINNNNNLKKYFLYNFHSLENIIFLELYTLCTLRKYEYIEIVNYKNDYFYELNNDFLLNVKILRNFLYFSSEEITLSILSFICENKYLNICDLYLFLTFLSVSISNISRMSRDSYKKYISLFFEKFFIFYQRMIELEKKRKIVYTKKKEQEVMKKNEGNENNEKYNENEEIYEECNNYSKKNVHGSYMNMKKAISFLFGPNLLSEDMYQKNGYSSCIFYLSNKKYMNERENIFLYNYYITNIIFILFKNINKDMSIESSVYCSDILKTIFEYCANFENINFLFFIFNIRTTWKELYLLSKDIFFKTVSIVLLKKHNFSCLNNSFIPLMNSHKQVDHSFSAFLLNLCFVSLNYNNYIKKKGNILDNNIKRNMISIKSNNLKLNMNERNSTDFFNCFIKFNDIADIKHNNKHLINYIEYLFNDNYKYNISRNIPLYILENFIHKIKKENIMKLTKHKDLENSIMYKLAYYINEFILYLKDNINFNNEMEISDLNKFLEISLCQYLTYINFDNFKLFSFLNNGFSCSYLILLKIYMCNILYYFFNYLNFLFLNNSNNFFFDCRGHIIFRNENEKEASSIIVWLSIKYICTLITSIVDFSFKFNITSTKNNSNLFSVNNKIKNRIVSNQIEEKNKNKEKINLMNDKKNMEKINLINDKKNMEKINLINDKKNMENLNNINEKKNMENLNNINEKKNMENLNNINEKKKNVSVYFFNNKEIHFIIQNLLCLLLYSKHVACQQYLSDCLLNICKIIVLKSNDEIQTIPLFYIYFILLIFKDDNNIKKKMNEKDIEPKRSFNKENDYSDQNDTINDSIKDNINNNNDNKNSELLNKIIINLNKILISKGDNKDLNDILSTNFIKVNFNIENSQKAHINYKNEKKDNKNVYDERSYIFDFQDIKFEINRKLIILILDNKKINMNFLRKSNNMCLALNSLAKSYRIKEQYIIYNFIIKIIINYLYNGNNKYKKVICLNIIKHIYTTIDSKTLYEYINDIYKISLIYYKSKFFCLKSSSTSLYNILTKRLLSKLNFSYHVSSNVFYFCTGSKNRIFKNINLTFFDLLNSINLLKIFLNVFIKKCQLLNNEFCNKYKYESFFDYSNFFAEFIPILIFLSNIIIFNNEDYFLLYNNKGDLSSTFKIYGNIQKKTFNFINNNNKSSKHNNYIKDDIYNYVSDSENNYHDMINNNNINDNVNSINIYFLFLRYFKKLFIYGNYFVQALICRIIVNVYLHIYLKLKKENLIFNFLNKIVINIIKKKKKNCYLLLFIEFIRRKESKTLIDKNNGKFRKIFFHFVNIFIKSKTYSEILLILQILNILYSKILISVNKNLVTILYNKLLLYKDMFLSVLINELLMKITKTINNFISILELHLLNKNENCIEAFLYKWKLFIKKREKKEFKKKENEINKLLNYNSCNFFFEYNKNKYSSLKKNESNNTDESSYDNLNKIDENVDERVYIYIYLLLFEIINMYNDNIKIKKYCFSILLTVVKFICIDNLALFDKMQQYYLKYKDKNYLDKYIIHYSYLVCVKFFNNYKKEDNERERNNLTENDFFKRIFEYIYEEKKKRVSSINCNFDDYIFDYAYFYFLLFMNFLSILYNKNSTSYTKYFVNAFINYDIIEYNYLFIEKEEVKLRKMNNYLHNNIKKNENVLNKEVISSEYHMSDHFFSEGKKKEKKENFDIIKCFKKNNCILKNYNKIHNNYYYNHLEGKNQNNYNCNYNNNKCCENINENKKYLKWYKSDLNRNIREMIYKKINNQNITSDIIYIKNPLKHLRTYNLFTSFFILLYSCLIFMLNDENELIRYNTKILILYFMNKNVINISKNMNNVTCTDFFIYYIIKFYNKISLNILSFCIYQTKSCIKNKFYYNPIKLFDQEKYNLYINNISLNHLFLFYYLFSITINLQNVHSIKRKNMKLNNQMKNMSMDSNDVKSDDNCNISFQEYSESKYSKINYLKNEQNKKEIIDFYIFLDILDNKKKECFVNNIKMKSFDVNITNDKINFDNYNLYLLKYRRIWKYLLSNIKKNMLSREDDGSLTNNIKLIEIFYSTLKMNYILDIKKSLNDYLNILMSNKIVDFFDSNFVICLSNLFNKIIILLINLYIFFQKKTTLYYNSYFYDEIIKIKSSMTCIYDYFKLTKNEINPFLYKSMELLLGILNNAFLTNKNFFLDIFVLLYSLKYSI
ncbi:conserved Plasmodium protein, unknown function [Plasmodium gallinaceum]|uniref:Uncharacterized protein n=1 Tax=Plasmodium gallinaceum TaxID=5849 RepID=A0A1J1H256_PLAGA|nr:conserved Plasmodium protein, unknown function [Plasmodium gallinaceum]CRG97603.1 conserved Plasmodium protein, unknown function [Plasmodium gallinaceum]